MMMSCCGHGWASTVFRSFLITSEWLHSVYLLTLLSCSLCSHYIPNEAEIVNLCARIPHHTNSERIPADGGFQIKVDDDPHLQHYAPERIYRISVSGTSLEHIFSSAYLVAVRYNSSNENITVGKFHLVDGGRLAFRVGCSHIVSTADILPKAEVYVMWKSPVRGTGCVEFRATVIASHVWYKDDGALTKVLCAKQTDGDYAENVQTVEISSKFDCCACGTAKYQLTFHSLWTRSIHPDEIQDIDTSLLRWSPVVGSSHSKHYVMWRFNTPASRGVSDICQLGDTRALEDEIRRQSSDIRTVIKTPGIQWTEEHGLQQQRWAHFSVDRKHHLLSILSRLSPSPDWCVGVSALDLCLDNCTWLADTVVRLFAWDAGVSGSSLRTSEDHPQPIHRLADHAENGPGLQFSSIRSAEPVALLRLRRFDPKPDADAASCSRTRAKDQTATKVDSAATEMDRPHHDPCVMGPWSQWSECSATCGAGRRARTRTAVVITASCPDLFQTTSEPCKAASCVPRCQLFHWSEWSACSDGFVLCSPRDARVGSCFRRRSRFFRRRGAEAFCNQTVKEEEKCRPSDAGIIAAFNTDVLSMCFSPADSGPCKGNFLRWYYDDILNGCRTFLYSGCRGNANRYSTETECIQACRQYRRHTGQGSGAESDISTIPTSTIPPLGIVETTVVPRSDLGDNPVSVVDCVMSPWSTWSDCSVTCGRHGVQTRSRTVIQPASGGGRKCPRRKLRRRRCSMPSCSDSGHCRYTEWSSWSACARSCGADTVQERIQRVQGNSSHGTRCPVKLQRRLCSLPSCV